MAYGDDENLLNMAKESGQRFRTYGFSTTNDIYASDIRFGHFSSSFDCMVDGKNLGQIALKVPGRVNVANALACIGLGLSLSLDVDAIRESLKSFTGVQRRFQLKHKIDQIWIVDDYAHHPTEIKATLETAQLFKSSLQGAGPTRRMNRLVTVFQPHRYSRVKGLLDDFARSLLASDHLVVTDIYAASEKPIPGVTSEALVDRIRSMTNKPVFYVPRDGIIRHLLDIIQPHDLVLTMGAGDITRISDELGAALKKRSAIAEV